MGATANLFSQGFNLAGGLISARAQKKAGSAERQLYDFNARISEMQAEDATLRGEISARRARQVGRQVIGAQRASFGRQGIDVNEGSALDVQADTAYLSELDALTIKNNAAREAWGYRVQAQGLRGRGQIAEGAARDRARGTILTTGANAFRLYYSNRRPKPEEQIGGVDYLTWTE